MADRKPDFSGYATKYELLCADGRTIVKGAFKHNDGLRVPLVWQHLHNDPTNILGHAILSNREDGIYVDGWFNETQSGKQSKQLVEHKDIVALSIYANKLIEKGKLVHQGDIREVSLVLSGANPGALIEHVSLAHADGTETISEEDVIIYSGLPINVVEEEIETQKQETEVPSEESTVEHADSKEDSETVQDVVASMNENQKKVLYALIAQAMGNDPDLQQSNSEGETFMKKNVFDNEDGGKTLTHAQMQEFAGSVFTDMINNKMTFKEAFVAHAGTYGIGSDRTNLAFLFPDAHMVDGEPGFDTRRMTWVDGWLSQTKHSPFSRLKKVWADLTPDAARAKGYITGNEKVEQVFALLKRTTEPTTIYKKQKLDRDDIVDIIDFDVVAWMWREMRFMLDEEVARAALVGDGRVFGTDDDAIDPSKIRPIFGDLPLFVHYLTLEASVTDYLDIIDAIMQARINYKGTGTPTLYTTNEVLTSMLLIRDTTDRRIYKSVAELAADLRVADIVEVEILEGVERTVDDVVDYDTELLGIMVNPRDYTYGSDKGGKISTFDDFDIDFNQYKYLIETRLSGSLLNPKSALVIERKLA